MFTAGYTHKKLLPKRSVRSRTISDYSPFGVLLPERIVNTGDFRYGFQGQEHDDEVKGEGNSVNFKYRMHDSRLGRFFAVDPLADKFSSMSPYNFCNDNPVYFVDLDGQAPVPPKNVIYYSMVKQADGSYSRKVIYRSSMLNVRSNNAVFRNTETGIEYPIENATYLEQDAAAIGVYTYWNVDGSIKRQVVLSSNNQISNYMLPEAAQEAQHNPGTTDLLLAASSEAVESGKSFTNTIASSRSGYTSGSAGIGSGKIYNKAKMRNLGYGLKGFGGALSIYSIRSTTTAYNSGEISKARRDYNYVNSGVAIAFPITGVPMALGDFLGQKYAPQIEHQVTNGTLNKFVSGSLEAVGISSSPETQSSSQPRFK